MASPSLGTQGSDGGNYKQILADLTAFSKSMFDQASNYTKLIFGLGYAGFFAVWSGTKANLGPKQLVGSALLMCLSLIAFIAFEIYQAGFNSQAIIGFQLAIAKPDAEIAAALEEHRKRTTEKLVQYAKMWKFVFGFCVLTGLSGAVILIVAFFRSLWKMIF